MCAGHRHTSSMNQKFVWNVPSVKHSRLMRLVIFLFISFLFHSILFFSSPFFSLSQITISTVWGKVRGVYRESREAIIYF